MILLDSIFSHSTGFNNMLYGMILLQLYSHIISVIFQYLSQDQSLTHEAVGNSNLTKVILLASRRKLPF